MSKSAEDILKHPSLQDPAMKERADCHMETQRRSRKRLLGEEETVGGEKRKRLEEAEVGEGGGQQIQ